MPSHAKRCKGLLKPTLECVAALALLVMLQGCGGSENQNPAGQGQQQSPQPADGVGDNTDRATPEATPQPDATPAETVAPARPDLPIDGSLDADGIELLWAAWGDKDRTRVVDVTEIVAHSIKDNGSATSHLAANYDRVGDPNPGQSKWLTVALRTPNGVAVAGLLQDSILYTRTPPQRIDPYKADGAWKPEETQRANSHLATLGARPGTDLLWVRWGNDGRWPGWGDAYEPVANMLRAEGRIYNKPANMGIARPNNTRGKTLRFLMAVDGQPVGGFFRHDSYLAVAQDSALADAPEFLKPGALGFDLPFATAALEDITNAAAYTIGDDGALFALNADATTLVRLDPETLEVTAKAAGPGPLAHAALAISPDGRQIAIAGTTQGFDPFRREPSEGRSRLARFHARTLQPLGRPVETRGDIRTIAFLQTPEHATRLLALHGSGDGALLLLDADTGAILSTTETRDAKDNLLAHPSAQRVYLPTRGEFTGYWYAAPSQPNNQPLALNNRLDAQLPGKRWTLLGVGSHALSDEGALVRLSNNTQRPIVPARPADVEPKALANTAAALHEPLGLLVLAHDNLTSSTLAAYRWPTLERLGQANFHGTLADLRLSADGQHAWARWTAPTSVVTQEGQPGPTPRLVRLDLAGLLGGVTLGAQPITPTDDPDPAVLRRLPLRSDIAALALSPDHASLYALDAALGIVYRLDPQTLDIKATSPVLPFGTHGLAYDPAAGRPVVSVAPLPFRSNQSGEESGHLVALDATTLTPVGESIALSKDPYALAITQGGLAIITGGSNQSTEVLAIDLATGQTVATHRGLRQASDTAISHAYGATLVLTSTNDVSPASINAFALSRQDDSTQPAFEPIRFEGSRGDGAGGTVWTTTDGLHAATQRGAIYAITPGTDAPGIARVSGTESISPITAMAGAQGRLCLARIDGTLVLVEATTAPQFTPLGQTLFDGVLTDFTLDPTRARLYAIHRPAARADRFARFDQTLPADIIAIDLNTIGW